MKSLLMSYALSSVLFSGAVSAQQMSLGEFEYRNSCAVCHGENGDGNGPFAGMMEIGPTDLTSIQKNNSGVFPVERLYNMIDGSLDVQAHGMRDMPVWGARYLARIDNDPATVFSAEERERYARNRILALVEYLSTIQVE